MYKASPGVVSGPIGILGSTVSRSFIVEATGAAGGRREPAEASEPMATADTQSRAIGRLIIMDLV
jgi:hypothetical protein